MSVPRTTSRSSCNTSNTATSRSSVMSFASSQRKLHKKEFAKFYADLCHLQHLHPLQAVKQHLDSAALDIVGDRIKFDEWHPIVSALRWDQSLHRVAIRLRHPAKTALMEADTDLKARNTTKQPALITKFVLYWLIESIRHCLSESTALTVLELDGLPLKKEFTLLLAQGILGTRSLQHLSLSKCGIQDEGAEVLCLAVRNTPSVISLDLSYCEITEHGAMSVAKLISHQKLHRYSEAWKQTLRYRDPDVEAMPGLRRLTLNHNPDIGDPGVQYLVEEIRDDLWLRALDLQNTGLTDNGAMSLVQLVRNNPNLAIVDARENSAMSDNTLSEIMTLLAINNADKTESEYKWIGSSIICSSSSGDPKKKISRSTVPRPWGSASSNRPRIRNPQPTSSYTRSQSTLTQKDIPTWRIQNDIHAKENESLLRQVQELNDILNREVRHKSELLRENQSLKEALERCQLDKKKMEETLVVLEETLNRLAVMYSNDDDFENDNDDIGELLNNMKSVLNKSQKEPKSINLNLKPLNRESSRQQKGRMRKNGSEQVIWEEIEPLSSADRGKHQERKQNNQSATKAQEIFAKIVSNKLKESKKESRSKRYRKPSPIPATSSDEESS